MWPDLADLGVSGAATAKAAKYVTAIDVVDGVITITYGGQANSKIATDTLALTPGENANGDVVWVCGNATEPSSATMQTTGATSVLNKYLPATCRAGFGA